MRKASRRENFRLCTLNLCAQIESFHQLLISSTFFPLWTAMNNKKEKVWFLIISRDKIIYENQLWKHESEAKNNYSLLNKYCHLLRAQAKWLWIKTAQPARAQHWCSLWSLVGAPHTGASVLCLRALSFLCSAWNICFARCKLIVNHKLLETSMEFFRVMCISSRFGYRLKPKENQCGLKKEHDTHDR